MYNTIRTFTVDMNFKRTYDERDMYTHIAITQSVSGCRVYLSNI